MDFKICDSLPRICSALNYYISSVSTEDGKTTNLHKIVPSVFTCITPYLNVRNFILLSIGTVLFTYCLYNKCLSLFSTRLKITNNSTTNLQKKGEKEIVEEEVEGEGEYELEETTKTKLLTFDYCINTNDNVDVKEVFSSLAGQIAFKLLSMKDGNICVCGPSIVMALELLRQVVPENQRGEFAKLFKMPQLPEHEIQNFFASYTNNPGKGFSSANAAVFVDPTKPQSAQGKDEKIITYQKNVSPYSVNVFEVFKGFNPRKVVNTLNAWCSSTTNNKIPRIMSQPPFSDPVIKTMIFINTIYHKGDWKEQFNNNWTEEERRDLEPLFVVEKKDPEIYKKKCKQQLQKNPLYEEANNYYKQTGGYYHKYSHLYEHLIKIKGNLPERVLNLRQDEMTTCINFAKGITSGKPEDYDLSLKTCKELLEEYLDDEWKEFSSSVEVRDFHYFEFVRDYSDYLIQALNDRFMYFNTSSGDRKMVFGLERKFETDYFCNDDFELVIVPYKDEFNCDEIFVKPKNGKTIEDVQEMFQQRGFLTEVLKSVKHREVFVQIPKFEFKDDFGIDISNMLPDGLKELLCGTFAEGSKIQMRHIAKEKIDKKGSEGAAATIIEVRTVAKMGGFINSYNGEQNQTIPVQFNSDFLFIKVQRKSAMVSFVGRVTSEKILELAPTPYKN